MDDRVQLATRNQELRDLNDKLNGVQEQLESREASIQNLSGEVENPKGENEELQRRNRNVEGELKDARTQLPESMADHANTNALLDARTAELKGAQTFLNKADLFSVGDVKRMLTTLNAEILQCSAWIVDKVFDLLGDIGQGNVTKEDLRVVDMSIGKQLRSTLEKNLVTANDPLPLQVALQVVPINHCSNILRKFDPTNDTANTAFQATYDLICATHDVAIAGRWRSIAMAQLTNSQKFGFDMSAVVSTIQTVISVAGGSRTRQSDPSCSTFVQSIEEHLEPVKKAVAILKHAIGQGITSLDLLPLVWAYSQPYDWKIMELSYGDEGEKACEGRLGTGIIGTIDIGLEIVSKRGHDGPARAETDIVVFPKIVLPETLEEVMTIASKGISGSSVVIDIL
ncbi:hypothetical protein FA15DRAFT_599018 [Coprinopsis marcescibilis]|uniref:Uncharacterized protein n=1 Tax=Coprinopsis marcescibilis TaxID=230819 RepID=A0A5C3KLJ6_COPMA|nr:hypothetical protein FA15DRAFT_599018 [Coprinopsis marcescibilis]